MSASEGFYYESAATGRFRRCYGASTEGNTATSSDESNRLRLQILPNQNLSTNRNRTEKELDLESMIRLASVGFLFLQGLLSGLSLWAFSDHSSEEFYAQFATRANEIRRYFFIGITLCLTGSLCMLDKDVLDSLKGRKSPTAMEKSNMGLVLVYFAALVISLVCSHADVRISDVAMQINDGDPPTGGDLQSVVRKFKGLSVTRSSLCILGWLVSCYRFVVRRSNGQT